MRTILEYMSAAHRTCDDAFARAEEAVLNNQWNEAGSAFSRFQQAMDKHFGAEEEILFPALKASGGPAGPVQVMLMEHAQMKDLFEQMSASIDAKDAENYAGVSETLLIVMQQHNHKEEQILYPMTDQFLASQRDALLLRIQSL